jgi:hypothetical protein
LAARESPPPAESPAPISACCNEDLPKSSRSNPLLKAFDRTDVGSVAIRLFNIASNIKGEPKLQFSLYTKMVHMLQTDIRCLRRAAVADVSKGQIVLATEERDRP